MHPNKKPRTEDGRPAAAVTAPPPTESVAPESNDVNLGDGIDWQAMDHLSMLRFLTPRVIEKGRPSRSEIGFFECLPQAVKDPLLSAEREARMETARISALTDIKAFFKIEGQADERDRKLQKEQKKNERDKDNSSDHGYTPVRMRVLVLSQGHFGGRVSCLSEEEVSINTRPTSHQAQHERRVESEASDIKKSVHRVASFLHKLVKDGQIKLKKSRIPPASLQK